MKPLPQKDLAHVLDHTRDLWREATGARFFITGGTGFFGMWLLESFAHANDTLGLGMRAVVLTRRPHCFMEKAPHLCCRKDISFLAGDVRTFPFPHGWFDYVIHAASDSGRSFATQPPQEMTETIVAGTRRVIDFAAQAAAKKILHVSSGAVYGYQPADMAQIPEDYAENFDALPEGTPYAEAKRGAERLCQGYVKTWGLQIKIARCFAFVGPHLPLDAHYAVGNFLWDSLERRPVRIKGDGSPVRSYLYAADLAVWLWSILFKGNSGRPYNVGSGDGVILKELARSVDGLSGNPLGVVVESIMPTGHCASRYVPDVSRACNELGLQAKISTCDALARTHAWYSEGAE